MVFLCLTSSTVEAVVYGDGSAYVLLSVDGGLINVINSIVLANVNGDGHAEVVLDTLGLDDIVDELDYFNFSWYVDLFNTWIDGEGTININNSVVRAETGSGEETALVELFAGDINITNASRVEAEVIGDGLALAAMVASNDINIDQTSSVSAITGDGLSVILGLAADDIDARGSILAQSTNGYALVVLLAGDDILAGNVSAIGGADLDAISELEDLLSGDDLFIDIGAQFGYSSGILLGSLEGDIYLGLIHADAVIAAALFGNIYDANQLSMTGDVYAHYLAMIAAGDIGTAEFPINTFIDILSAYSWNEGDIYVNEADNIELGLYLPIFQNFDLIAEIGFSVAANNGIIHIVSDGDMTINSVVSPRGGVFLQSTNGSIYAGHGWCPLVTSEDLSSIPFGDYLSAALMDLSDTQWMNAFNKGDEETSYYFSPIMIGLPGLTAGPNVIAGGYSYIGAPTGTIGVGLPGGIFTTAPGICAYNPLQVNIQALNGDVNSAVPSYMIPSGLLVPPAALTIEMGGSSAPDYTINTGDGNGPLGISGMFEGIVRPGTTAVTGVTPAPYIYNTNASPLNPLGYVFYSDTDNGCIGPLDGSSAANTGMLQIWPKPRFGFFSSDLFLYDFKRLALPYLEQFAKLLFNLMDTRLVNFYHPLVESGMSGFEDFVLELGAYQFIDGALNINGHDGLLPILEQIKKKKKGQK